MPTFNTDDPADVARLIAMRPELPFAQTLPRRTRYGSLEALDIGLEPIEAYPDVLVPEDAYEEVIRHCHEQKVFPMYWAESTWAPAGFRYNQASLGYCWTWGGTGALMCVEAAEGKPTTALAPVSMGYLVGWRNNGNYLESFIEGARNDGICPAINGEINSHQNSASVWAPFAAERKLHQLNKVFDCDPSSQRIMLQHIISGLACGRPGYNAFDWWGHSTHYVGVLWTPGTYLNVTLRIRNSHDESEPIDLTGSRMIADENYIFISTKLAA